MEALLVIKSALDAAIEMRRDSAEFKNVEAAKGDEDHEFGKDPARSCKPV